MISKIKSLLKENRTLHKKTLNSIEEVKWANIYHDSIRGKVWLQTIPLNIGRWAGSYSFFYILNRILTDYKPKQILEFGLGESSKFVSTFLDNFLTESKHVIIEQSEEWKIEFENRFKLSVNSNITIYNLIQSNVKGFLINAYDDFVYNSFSEYDLYIIDGPFGSKNYSRYEIVEIAKTFKKDKEFIIMMDDYQRKGEKNTIKDLYEVLEIKKIKTYSGLYTGDKSVYVIGTEKYKFIQSL